MLKIKIGSKTHDIEIQDFENKIIIHCGEIHVADVEIYLCLEKLKERLILEEEIERLRVIVKKLWPNMPWPIIQRCDENKCTFGVEVTLYVSSEKVLKHELAHAVAYHLGYRFKNSNDAHGPEFQGYYDSLQ